MALFSFTKVVAKISKFTHILEYNKSQELIDRIPNYCVGMGFGLHQGWAIEGTIGSYFKIDASYLSPNVNMASRLEAATKAYDVKILISEPMYDLLSRMVKNLCREIDRVLMDGTVKSMKLYTIDISTVGCTPVDDEMLYKPIKVKK
jgi:class 3 adenylate cyclase